MSATKTKPGQSTKGGPAPQQNTVSALAEPTEVLTLGEAAAYLRIKEADVLHAVEQQSLPGRLIGTEWRFLKSALQGWLGTPPKRPSKEAVLARIGSWQDDPYLDQELEEIHRQRGRPVAEERK
jgi:excisionase family DNA binding protein